MIIWCKLTVQCCTIVLVSMVAHTVLATFHGWYDLMYIEHCCDSKLLMTVLPLFLDHVLLLCVCVC